MNNYILSYDDVTIKYGNFDALKNISFDLEKEDFLNIIGPNGAGKTTLIKSLIGEVKLDKGFIHMQSRKIGYVPQKQKTNNDFPLTVLEFIYTGFDNQKLFIPKKDKELVISYLKIMKLNETIIDQKISVLSGGELQRIYLIRALISKPELLILDEPASALDPDFRIDFYSILKKLKEQDKMTIIHITHDLNDVILRKSKVMYLDQEIKFYGSCSDYFKLKKDLHYE